MIRTATRSDAWAIADIYNYYVTNTAITFELDCITPYKIVERMEQTGSYFVCEESGFVVGYACISGFRERKVCDDLVQSSIYLKSGFGSKGIGFQLYSELLSRIAPKYQIIIAGIALSNFPSIRLHEKCGFQKVLHFSETARKFGEWIDVGFWQKTESRVVSDC